MKKIYKKLTEEQKKRGVIFSSCLSEYRTEQKNDEIHEVFKINEEYFKNKPAYESIKFRNENDLIIKRLKDDKFFNDSHWNFNILRR